MELGESILTFLVVIAITLWNAGEALKDLQSRQQADKTPAGPAAAEAGGNAASLAQARPDSVVGPDVPREIADQLGSVGLVDPAFDRVGFLRSVGMVYETVVAAFARGDRELLQDLLSDDVYETFLDIIDARAIRGERVELSIVRVNRTAIVDAHVFNGRMQITVNIESELVNATRGPTGAVIAGDPARVVTASDNWTFAKELASRSPAWKLVATEPAESAPSKDADNPLPGQASRQEATLAGQAAAQ
jgi:predicted lipid-binding transport protein (Tim44 family)